MANIETVRVLHTDLHDHPAVLAWRELKSLPVKPERIEILKVRTHQNGELRRIVCRLVDVSAPGATVIGKRCRPANAVVENAIYKHVLPGLPISHLEYYGMVEEPNNEYCWLFLEDAGEQVYSDVNEEHRVLRAHWLGLMHTSATHLTVPSCLPDKGPDHYLDLMQYVRRTLLKYLDTFKLRPDEKEPLETFVSLCDELELHWDEVKAFCEGFPRTLIHGDFVPKNLRFRSSQAGLILLPFDWGEGGWGIPAIDIMDVDISSYWPIVRESWPWLSIGEVQRLAFVGKIFFTLDAASWILYNFKTGWLEAGWLEKPISNLKVYATWLVDAIRAAGLNFSGVAG